MKKTVSAILVLILTFAFAGTVFADYPKNESYFYDGWGIVSDEAKAELKSVNDKLFVDRGMRIAVCIVENTGETETATYARGVFGEWKVNGVLILIVKDPNVDPKPSYYAVQSTSISDVLTNQKLSDLLTSTLEPDFKTGNYSAGIMTVVKAISSFITENVKTDDAPGSGASSGGKSVGKTILKIFLWLIIIAAVLIGGGYALLRYLEKKQEERKRFEEAERRRRLAERGRGNYYGDPRRPDRDPRRIQQPRDNRDPAQRRPQNGGAGRFVYPDPSTYSRPGARPQDGQRRPEGGVTRRPPARGQRVDFDREYYNGSADGDFVDPSATREFKRR